MAATVTVTFLKEADYLPLYGLILHERGGRKMKTIRLLWEGSSPEVEAAAYTLDKSKLGHVKPVTNERKEVIL